MLPHTRRGFYCHSGLPDDLGIQYQSYPTKDTVVAQVINFCIYPSINPCMLIFTPLGTDITSLYVDINPPRY